MLHHCVSQILVNFRFNCLQNGNVIKHNDWSVFGGLAIGWKTNDRQTGQNVFAIVACEELSDKVTAVTVCSVFHG